MPTTMVKDDRGREVREGDRVMFRRPGGGSARGTVVGITPDGRVVIDTDDGATYSIKAADVVVYAKDTAMATSEGALHHDELLGEPQGMTRNVLTVPAWRFSISTGRWDQFAKLGQFEKDGASVVFDEKTLGQIVDNFAGRQNDLGMDHEHQALNAPLNGQPAPALAWYSALALVVGGKLVRFASHDESVQKPDPAGLEDGLYGFRAHVTPLGEQLLPNYRYISPAFTTDGANEKGEPIGYDLLNIAATSTPFLDGMAPIEMRRMTASPIAFDLRSDARESFAGDVITCPDCQKPGVKVIGISPRLADHDKPSGGRCPSSGKYVTEFTRGRLTAMAGGYLSQRDVEDLKHMLAEAEQELRQLPAGAGTALRSPLEQEIREIKEALRAKGAGMSVAMARVSGYVYHLESGTDWRGSPDDDWETVVRSVDGDVVGRRQIDGSSVVVISSGGQFYAALPQNLSMCAPPGVTGMARDVRGQDLAVGDRVSIDKIGEGQVVEVAGDRVRIRVPGASPEVEEFTPSEIDFWKVTKLSRRSAGHMSAGGSAMCPKCSSTNLGYSNEVPPGQWAPNDAAMACRACGAVFMQSQIKQYAGMTAHDVKVGERVRVTTTYRDNWGKRLSAGLTGTVQEVSESGGSLESYRVAWSDRSESWVWTRHEPPVERMSRPPSARRRAAMARVAMVVPTGDPGVDCPKCDGYGYDDDGVYCETCKGIGRRSRPRFWTTTTDVGMARADIKIERTSAGRWRVYVESPSGFQVVGEYATEAEAMRAAEEAPARGFRTSTTGARRFAKEKSPMDPKTLMAKLGLADGAPVEEKLAKFAHHFACGDATPEELTAMAESLDEHKDDEGAAKMSARFKKFAEAPEPFAGAETPEEEAKEHAALASMARTLGLPDGARPSQIAVAFSAKTAPLTTVADLQGKVARLEEQLAARAAAETTARAQAFARQAVTDGRTTADKAKLVEETFIQGGDKAAEALLFQKGTFTVLRRFTAGGEVPGKASPPTSDAQPEPDDIRGRVAAKANEIMESARKAGAPIAFAVAMSRVRSVDPELYAAYAALGTPSR